jgi:cytochrome c biogenesis protein CcmG/thiol:disulfide interchange protein DsbE
MLTDQIQEKEKRKLPNWVVGLTFVLLIAFLALIGMGLRRAQSGPITIGQRVPAFTLTSFDGQTFDTGNMAGKVIVVNFWASWCKPCEQEAAELEAAWQVYRPGGEVVFLGVDYVDTEPEALGFLAKFGITYPNGPDLRTRISQMFRIQGVPETYIIDREGKLAFVKKGPFQSQAEIHMAVDSLLD